jgi:hypothetical protein
MGHTYSLRLDRNGAHSVIEHQTGDFQWTVGIVQTEPGYQDLKIEATPNTVSILDESQRSAISNHEQP